MKCLLRCTRVASWRRFRSPLAVSSNRGFSGESPAKKTLLHDWHVRHGGKMVDFAGFSMPVEYSGEAYGLSLLESTKHTRTAASLFDVSHMGQLQWRGADRVRFIEHLCVGSVKPLKPMQCKYSLMLNEKGGAIDDLIFMNRTADDSHYMVINAGRIKEDLTHINKEVMKKKKDGWDVDYEFLTTHQLMALQGPKAVEVLGRYVAPGYFDTLKFFFSDILNIDGIECQVSRTGYTGEDGFEIAVPNDDAIRFADLMVDGNSDSVKLAGLGARDALRLEAGLCLYGNDLDETTTPVEADLLWTMSKKRKREGEFVGHEVVRDQIANGVSRIRVGMVGTKGPTPRAHMKIKDAESDAIIGEVTSGSFSPCLQQPIAMGYINPQFAAEDTTVKVEIRPKRDIEVKVCKVPFVPKGYFGK